MDVNPPTFQVSNVRHFDGSNRMKRLWLKKNRHRIRNWRQEWRKSYDMSAAGSVKAMDENGCLVLFGRRTVRLRMVNKNLVIPEQV